jgi:hypothetical protein
MNDIYFHTLPVYRLDSASYYSQREKYVTSNIPNTELHKQFYREHPEQEAQLRDHLNSKFGGCWDFNEIVGFVRLHILGSQVRGEYFGVKAKRIIRTRKKVFEYQTHKLAPEVEIHHEFTNENIFDAICVYIELCRGELKNRFIDDRDFMVIGRHINWKEIIK